MNTYSQSHNTNRHSESMEAASMTLAVISLISCFFPYLSLPCGALAIIFATLSRGGQMQYGAKAQAGLIVGITALTITFVLYAATFAFIYIVYGSVDAFMDAYSKMSGMDYQDFIQQLMPSTQFQ